MPPKGVTLGAFLPAQLKPPEQNSEPAQQSTGLPRPQRCRCEGPFDLCWRYPSTIPNAACKPTWERLLAPFQLKGRQWTIVELRSLWPHTAQALTERLQKGRMERTLKEDLQDDLQVLVDLIQYSCKPHPRPPRAGMKTLIVQGRILAEAIAQDALFQLDPSDPSAPRPDRDLVDLINRLREHHPNSLLAPALHVLRTLGNTAVHLDRESARLTDAEIGDAAAVCCRFVVLVVDAYMQMCANLHRHEETEAALAQPLQEAPVAPIPAPNVLLRPREATPPVPAVVVTAASVEETLFAARSISPAQPAAPAPVSHQPPAQQPPRLLTSRPQPPQPPLPCERLLSGRSSSAVVVVTDGGGGSGGGGDDDAQGGTRLRCGSNGSGGGSEGGGRRSFAGSSDSGSRVPYSLVPIDWVHTGNGVPTYGVGVRVSGTGDGSPVGCVGMTSYGGRGWWPQATGEAWPPAAVPEAAQPPPPPSVIGLLHRPMQYTETPYGPHDMEVPPPPRSAVALLQHHHQQQQPAEATEVAESASVSNWLHGSIKPYGTPAAGGLIWPTAQAPVGTSGTFNSSHLQQYQASDGNGHFSAATTTTTIVNATNGSSGGVMCQPSRPLTSSTDTHPDGGSPRRTPIYVRVSIDGPTANEQQPPTATAIALAISPLPHGSSPSSVSLHNSNPHTSLPPPLPPTLLSSSTSTSALSTSAQRQTLYSSLTAAPHSGGFGAPSSGTSSSGGGVGVSSSGGALANGANAAAASTAPIGGVAPTAGSSPAEASRRLLQLVSSAESPPSAKITQLLSLGASLATTDKSGMSALHLASYRGHTAAATAMLAAVRHPDAVAAAITAADREGRTPLWVAAQRGHMELVEVLLTAAAAAAQGKENGNSGSGGGGGGALAVVDMANMAGVTPLRVAAAQGHSAVVEALLQAGTDVAAADKDGYTPLYVACARSHLVVTRALLAAGAPVDRADKAGRTPLWAALHPGGSAKSEASAERRGAVVHALLAAGADVHLLPDGRDRDYCWQLLAASIAAGE